MSITFKNIDKSCFFLMIMSLLTSAFLTILNLYIGYLIVLQLRDDGWSFMGGIFLSAIYIVTIPALIFSFLSVRKIKDNSTNKYLFSLLSGIAGTLAGFVLYNAVSWWFLIVLFHVLLIASAFICKNRTLIINKKNKQPLLHSNQNKEFRIGIFFQIVGLTLLLLLSVSFYTTGNVNNIQSFIGKYFSITISTLHGIVLFAFFRKKLWALKFKYIESYLLLFVTVLIFLSAIISEGVSLTNYFLLLSLFFLLLILLFIYLIHNYRKLIKSAIFNSQAF